MTGKKEVDIHKLKQQDIETSSTQLDNHFIKEHMPMIEAMVANILGSGKVPPGIDFDDLVSWGSEGLLKAHANYNPDKGSQFKTYAYYRIRGEIFDKIRKEWRYRNPTDYQDYKKRQQERIADFAEEALNNADKSNAEPESSMQHIVSNSAVMCLMSLDNNNIDIASEKEGTKDPEQEYIDDKENVLWEEISKLEDEEKQIIELFYLQDMKQKEIAETLNFSRSTVCRMHMKILEKLRNRLKGRV